MAKSEESWSNYCIVESKLTNSTSLSGDDCSPSEVTTLRGVAEWGMRGQDLESRSEGLLRERLRRWFREAIKKPWIIDFTGRSVPFRELIGAERKLMPWCDCTASPTNTAYLKLKWRPSPATHRLLGQVCLLDTLRLNQALQITKYPACVFTLLQRRHLLEAHSRLLVNRIKAYISNRNTRVWHAIRYSRDKLMMRGLGRSHSSPD